MTLHLYFARKFALRFFLVLLGFLLIVALIESVELLRQFRRQDVPYSTALYLSLLSSAPVTYRVFPFIVTLATLGIFLDLARSSEMIATRAAGRSALRALVAPVLAAFVIGLISVAALNPILATTSKVYETSVNQLRSGRTSSFSLTRSGLWLRQGSADGQTVIFAERANFDGSRLFDVTFFEFGADGRPLRRIEANSARLRPGVWQIGAGKSWDLSGVDTVPEKVATEFATESVSSDLTSSHILDSFGDPALVSIWNIPSFIQRLEKSGLSSLRHRVYFHLEIAQPFLMASMVLIAAGFAMRPSRFGQTGVMVVLTILTGFGIFYLRNFAQILGSNGEIPVVLAAWGTPTVAFCLALGLLLHLEDG